MHPKEPTKQLVQQYLRQFRLDPRYFLADQAITKLFEKFPKNQELDDVWLKVTVVNHLYGTNVYNTFDLAQHIVSCRIDNELRRGSSAVVDQIADVTLSGKRRHVFSFATKYCSWHDRDNYPLYDYYVQRLLVEYKRKDSFAQFTSADLRFYSSYRAIVAGFREFYGLGSYSFKALDKFLWLYGKDLFQRRR